MVDISVIVPTYHDWERLLICLSALKTQEVDGFTYEIIVANNAPADIPPSELQFDGLVKVINEAKPGSYAARNAALKKASGTIVAFTDSDCIPEPNWLSNGFNHLNKGYDRVGGNVSLFFQGKDLSWAEAYEKIYAFKQEENVTSGVSVTANLFVKKEIFNDVGLFDDRLLSGGDFAWNRRATLLGKTIKYGEDAVVFHPARKSFKDLMLKRKRVVAGVLEISEHNKFNFIIKNLVPPFGELLRLIRLKEVPLHVRFKAYLAYWSLKIYSVYICLFRVR